MKRGLAIERLYTSPDVSPYNAVRWEKRRAAICNPDGSVVFEMDGVEVPDFWSQLATDILASKYLRKAGLHGDPGQGETSAQQVVYRVAHTIRTSGEEQGGYFATKRAADTFEAELAHMLIHQIGAFNSPVFFNTGLLHEYGIEGGGGNWAWNIERARQGGGDEFFEVGRTYERPQCSACFIQSIDDDLMGIYELVKTEARLFKGGSGTGTNFSALRGRQEKLSGGGTSSGLMSFLEVFDRAAGSTKSGGTTRRAAKMVCLDMDHPEIVDFIGWKVREEKKALVLIAAGYPRDFNGEAYHTVSGQNSNNSVRVTDTFMKAITGDGDPQWATVARTTGAVVELHSGKDLWKQIADAAWACADPGVQYDTTINAWHTCPNSGRINASNPCSEYLFLDDTACNLASLNLLKFLRKDGSFDTGGFCHAVRIFFLAQEILVDLSSYPTRRIAENSHAFRPLGLGYANLGALLMVLGIPYDSSAGRSWAGAITALMTGQAYAMSAMMAKEKGAFAGYADNDKAMFDVMRLHEAAAMQLQAGCPEQLRRAALEAWTKAREVGAVHGYRNAQATVLAPTGTIGLLMDCDTTGVEPEFSLVKWKKLAGGGLMRIINECVPEALDRLGYKGEARAAILRHIRGSQSLRGTPHINRESLAERGFTPEELLRVETATAEVPMLEMAFSATVLGQASYDRIWAHAGGGAPTKSMLEQLGFTQEQITEAADVILGHGTADGATGLSAAHLPVFDCAARAGRSERVISPVAHLEMMAAVQPFLSGGISKTVNLSPDVTPDTVRGLYELGWKLGLKAVALYRDGSKASQPLSAAAAEPDKTTTLAPTPIAGGRHRLPKRRRGFTQEAKVDGHKVYIRTGEYQDGTLGEIFIDLHKEGASFRSIMNCFAMAVSIGLQHGVPLKAFVEMFIFTRFEPAGFVEGHDRIKLATSIVDYVFRGLAIDYLGRNDLVQGSDGPPRPAIETKGAPPKVMMGDGPACTACGHWTARNASCYRCLNCGNSMGCS